MSEQQLNEIADKADMIIANYSFTITDNSDVKILYLSNPEQACVLNKDGDMIKSSMGDAQLALVQAYYLKNKDLIGTTNAEIFSIQDCWLLPILHDGLHS